MLCGMCMDAKGSFKKYRIVGGLVLMLATPPFGASSNIALRRANIKPPLEVVVGDLENTLLTFDCVRVLLTEVVFAITGVTQRILNVENAQIVVNSFFLIINLLCNKNRLQPYARR